MSDDESPEGPDGREPRRPRRTVLELPQVGGGFKMPRFGGDGMPKLPLRTLGCGALILVALLALFSMYYQIAPYEQGVVLRFGKHVGNVGPGPHMKLPFGITQVLRVETEKQHKLEFGFRTKEPGQRTVYVKEGFGAESSMLTGDLNIASVEWVVQYRIDDPYKYLFRLRDTAATVAAVAEAEMRGAVGDMGFDEVIKSKRAEIEEQVRQRMREILTAYDSGVDVKLVQLQDVHPPDPVKDSFEDVNRALQEMERSINESLQERNKVLYRVEGEAKQRVAQCIEQTLAPMRERYADLMAHPARIEDTLLEGARKARTIAAPFLAQLREAVGLRPMVAVTAAPAASAVRAKAALPVFKQYREADGRFYFKLLAGDGRLLLQSEGFAQGKEAGQWVARLRREAGAALSVVPASRGEGVSEQDVAAALTQLAEE